MVFYLVDECIIYDFFEVIVFLESFRISNREMGKIVIEVGVIYD